VAENTHRGVLEITDTSRSMAEDDPGHPRKGALDGAEHPERQGPAGASPRCGNGVV